MIKPQFLPLLATASILILSLPATPRAASNDNEDFKWQDAAKELDALPYPQPFIDSVKKAHTGGTPQKSLRSVSSGQYIDGETLVFDVGWSVFRAGYLILSTTNMRSRGLIRISAKAMTNNTVSAIYKVRNHEISWVDAEGLYPHLFEQHIREGKKYKSDSYIVYDNSAGKLFQTKRGPAEIESPKFTHDYISLIYYARSMPLSPGATFEANLYSRPKTQPLKFTVHEKRETVQTNAGTFNCLKVEPKFIGDSRVFSKNDKIEIWITDDEKRLPVMFKSKAKIGSLNAKLVQSSK
jgi:hypothetical protein